MISALRRGSSAGRVIFWLVALILIGGLAYVVYSKRQPPSGPEGPSAVRMAEYLRSSHQSGVAAGPRFSVRELEKVHAAGRDWLGKDVTLEEIAGTGVQFVAAGGATVPGDGSSAQYLFDTGNGQKASMFLQVYRITAGERELDMNKAYTLEAGGGAPIVVSRKGGLVYYFVSDTAAGYQPLLQAFGIPASSGKY